ncbi:tetratricopeptide repeat protein [Shewanella sp. PP-Sp27a-2]
MKFEKHNYLFLLVLCCSSFALTGNELNKDIIQSAQNGDATSSLILGRAYELGNGVKQDLSNAFKWYLISAEKGDVNAQIIVATKYATGDGIVENLGQAFKWYLKAAQQGLPEAQNIVGRMYAAGDGIERDFSKSFYGT